MQTLRGLLLQLRAKRVALYVTSHRRIHRYHHSSDHEDERAANDRAAFPDPSPCLPHMKSSSENTQPEAIDGVIELERGNPYTPRRCASC